MKQKMRHSANKRPTHPVIKRKLSFRQTVFAVLSAFLGVRKNTAHQRDLAELNPIHIIITGVVMAILFVIFLLCIVRLALNYA